MGLNKLVPHVRHWLFFCTYFMDIKDILLKFSGLEVLVVGDLMIDCYVNGVVTRVSPEAPVPLVEWQEEENRLGGAANVAINLADWGQKSIYAPDRERTGEQCFP